MPAADAKLVAALDEQVERRDLGREDRRVVVRQDVDERAETDLAGALGRLREERERVRRNAELRKEEVLDDRVRVVAEPVSVHDLLERLVVCLFL